MVNVVILGIVQLATQQTPPTHPFKGCMVVIHVSLNVISILVTLSDCSRTWRGRGHAWIP